MVDAGFDPLDLAAGTALLAVAWVVLYVWAFRLALRSANGTECQAAADRWFA
jgi:hypothetical protein